MHCESQQPARLWSPIELVIHNEHDEELPIALEFGDERILITLSPRQSIRRRLEHPGRNGLRVRRECREPHRLFDPAPPREHGRDAIHIEAGLLRGRVIVIAWTGRDWIAGVPR